MASISVTARISIEEAELEESYVRASGPGGQSVNTTDSAVMLRFDAARSPSLPEPVKARLLALSGSRATADGVIVLRSEGSRSQLMNRREVRERLFALIREAATAPKPRRPTRPGKAARLKRLETKSRRASIKSLRGKPQE